jgi:predicted dehydrogenase
VIESLAVPLTTSSAARGGSEPVRVGVVGAGLIAQVVHLPHLRELPSRLRVVALAEPGATARQAVAQRYGIPRAVADHRELLGDVDALVVCSPNGTHADVVLDALEAGVHVLVEKPLCLTLADADRIVAARDRTGLVVQVGYMKRYDPAYEALLDDLPADGGAAHAPWHVATTTYDPGLASWFAPPEAPASGPDDLPAAAAHELADRTAEQVAEAVGTDAPDDVAAFADRFLGALVHDVNAVHGVFQRLGLDPPDRVVDAFSVDRGRACGGAIALPGGGRWTMAWLELPGLGDFREEIALYGADGIRRLEFPAPYLRAPTTFTRTEGARDGAATRTFRSWREAYVRELMHFQNCITAGVACRTPPEQARTDIALLADLFRASLQVPA